MVNVKEFTRLWSNQLPGLEAENFGLPPDVAKVTCMPVEVIFYSVNEYCAWPPLCTIVLGTLN